MICYTPLPPEMTVSADYSLEISSLDGQRRVEASAWECRVSAIPFNREWPGHQRPLDQTELASWCRFSADEPVRIRIVAGREFSRCIIRPLSRGIVPEIDGQTVTFVLDKPGYFSIELDNWHQNLHLFAEEIIDYGIQPGDPGVLYYANGLHAIGDLHLTSGQTLFMEPGAVLRGGITIDDAVNVRILGEGVIDNSQEKRIANPAAGCIKIRRAANVEIRGPIMLDSAVWTAAAFGCTNILFDRVKLIGMWRYNSDGIDLCNCANCQVTNSFLRCFDDVIVLKGLKGWDNRCVENIYVSGCVLWCDWGRNLEIGAETCADEYRNIVFRDCDLIHGCHMQMDLQNGDRADVHDLLFEDIRVEYSADTLTPIYQHTDEQIYDGREGYMPHLFYACHYCGRWSKDNILGQSHRILFRNISVVTDPDMPLPPSAFLGADEQHQAYDIRIEALTVNGAPLTADEQYPIETNTFTHNIHLFP